MQTGSILEQIRVLHLEDSEYDRLLVASMLEQSGLPCEIRVVENELDFSAALRETPYDLIISDFAMPSYDGLRALSLAKEAYPEIPFVFFSGTIGEERAIESLKSGAVDYILKQSPSRLVPAIRQALQHAKKQAQLRVAEQRNREQVELLDKAGDAILVCSLDGKITFWNLGAERVYGWTREEALGREAVDLFMRDKAAQLEQAGRALTERGEWSGEMEHAAKDGRKVIVQTRITLILDDQGRPKSKLILNTDITERRQLEEQFLRSQRLESLGALVSGIAHDLNNALAPIVMGVDILRTEDQSKTSVGILDMIGTSAKRGSDMVRQMLAFARGGGAEKTRLDIRQLLREMAKIIKDTFPKAVRARMEIDPKCGAVNGVPTQLHQVLMNLCVNARDAMMPAGGTITLSARNVRLTEADVAPHPGVGPGDYLAVSVADTGTGIPADQIGNIFKPFYTTKEQGQGTGLGLPTSQTIVKNHGGFMTVESEVGRGTAFRCYLPLAEEAAASAESAEARPALPAGNGEVILVVDDEVGILAMIQTTLEHYGYQVKTAGEGPRAAELLNDHRDTVKLVITALSMQYADKRPMLDVLRKVAPKSRYIALSSLALEGSQQSAPADAVVQKPFTIEDLLTTVHQVLAAPAS